MSAETGWADLAARIEQASGPDREVDYRVCWLARLQPWAGMPEERLGWCMSGSEVDRHTPRYTASVDAVLALIAEKLPGYFYEAEGGQDGHVCRLFADNSFGDGPFEGKHPKSECLARLAAACRALAGQSAKEMVGMSPLHVQIGLHYYACADQFRDRDLPVIQEYARHFVEAGLMREIEVGSSRVDLQACKLEYSIVSPK